MTKDQFMKLLGRCQQLQQMLIGETGVMFSLFVNNRSDNPSVNALIHHAKYKPVSAAFSVQSAYTDGKAEVKILFDQLKVMRLL